MSGEEICELIECQTFDFLLFTCSLCGGKYCQTHRSRFRHNCIDEINRNDFHQTDEKDANSVRSMMKRIEHRFDDQTRTSKEHFKVQSSLIDKNELPSDQFNQKIDSLTDRNRNTGISNKQRRINDKTKEILIASKSTGNQSIDAQDRFYLCFQFDEFVKTTLYLYFNKNSTLGEVLHYVANHYPKVVFGQPTRPSNLTLILFTDDTPDWREFDRSEAIQNVLCSYETVSIRSIVMAEAVQASNDFQLMKQQQQQQRQLQQNEKQSSLTNDIKEQPLIDESASNPSLADTTTVYSANDSVWYTKISYGDDGSVMDTTDVPASIIAVHHDDYPNVYYTIKLIIENKEKQTDSNRLKKRNEKVRMTLIISIVCIDVVSFRMVMILEMKQAWAQLVIFQY
jgi:hypothetical protein